MTKTWSLEDYCSKQEHLLRYHRGSNSRGEELEPPGVPSANAGDEYWSAFLGTETDTPSNRKFFSDLKLPVVHPFCLEESGARFGISMNADADADATKTIPPMGSLNFLEEVWTAGATPGESHAPMLLRSMVTVWYMVAPALLAMGELWLRLFAGWIGPMGIVWLVLTPPQKASGWTSHGIVLTVASCLVLMTDTLYVLQNGPTYGLVLFAVALALSARLCWSRKLRIAACCLVGLVVLAARLVVHPGSGSGNSNSNCSAIHFGHPADDISIDEGLYYDSRNALVSRIAERWRPEDRVYDAEHGATAWMPTGDSRTGLPFILHHHPPEDRPIWNRVFLEVQEEQKDPVSEFVALDVSFPKTSKGHDPTKPIYLVFHGLGGGSMEEYIRDLAIRRNAEGSTVVVMIARGLMDTPIRGLRIFHGARTSDAHASASALRTVLGPDQLLVGAGYSMGAIVLSNYVASYGSDCALDAAVAVSGGLDMRYQEHAYRTQRLWQPMLAGTLRDEFLLGKFGHRVKDRLSPSDYLRVLRASHITEIDRYAVVPFNGFDDLDHYYREMSALGDIPHDPFTGKPNDTNEKQLGKIHTVSIPFLVVHALDDPLVTWRATVHNEGFMSPQNLSRSGSGHLMLLLTKAGGHVGWPLGMWPTRHKWKWMSDIVMSFARSVEAVKRETTQQRQHL
eukprot:CAMPEP_0172364926 /NCGR_PEP_ID=MMETSP1060-20121228/7948_1 /TAXON_ID=37318 /ORGANISM="Pseudo-nitzschia pungens, Strain cf. cingulata" /LENGTH=678 /DNA_ID=CAMNT_0013088057 /DNA_START=36 /DNA_END=2072 /DNA_ORIENTATION=+